MAKQVGVTVACRALGVNRATLYRHRRPRPALRRSRPSPARTLSSEERATVLAALHEPRFMDTAPAAVHAMLLDEGIYHCSVRTMYRILQEQGETGERRRQLHHPAYEKPELLSTRPNELWSWDITKLKGPVKGQIYCLYVILDVFSRMVVGWMVAERESA